MKKLLFLLCVLALLASCSADPNEGENLLKTKIEHGFFENEPTIVSNYTYNGNKLENIVKSDDTQLIYVYDGDLIVNIKTYRDVTLINEEQYQYDSSERLIQSKRFWYELDYCLKKTYTYNADLTVTETTYTGNLTSQNDLWQTDQLQFENGQIKIRQTDYATMPDGIFTAVYTYDDKMVPEQNILGFDKLNLVNTSGTIMHNIIWVEQTDTVSGEVGTFGYGYLYNANNMPSGFVYTQGTIAVDGGPTEYFYN
jgi:hypothetical protein